MKFQEKVFLIRELYADRAEIQQCPLTPGSPSTNLGMGSTTKPTKSVSLPFNPTSARADREAWNRLAGKDPRAKPSEAGGLAPGTYLRRPDYREKSYRVTGQPKVTQAAHVPFQFRTLQPGSKSTVNPSMTLSHTEVTDLEVQLRRTAVVLSHQDWFLGSVRLLAEKAIKDMEPVPEHLAQMLELLHSGTRAGFDAQHLVGNLAQNWVLRRRDCYLRDTFWDLQATAKRKLRQNDLGAGDLFAVDTIEAVTKSYIESANSRKASQPSGQQASRRAPAQGRPSVLDRSYQGQSQTPSWPAAKSPPKSNRGGGHSNRGSHTHRGKPSSSYTPSKKKGERGGRK